MKRLYCLLCTAWLLNGCEQADAPRVALGVAAPEKSVVFDRQAEVKKLPIFAFLPAMETDPFTQVRMLALGRQAVEHRGRKGHFQIGVFDSMASAEKQLEFLRGLEGQKLGGILIEPIVPDEKLGAVLESFSTLAVPVFVLNRAVPGAKSATVVRDDLAGMAELAAEKTLRLISAWKASPDGGSRSVTVMMLGQDTPRDDAIRGRFSTALIPAADVRVEPDVKCDGTAVGAEKFVAEVFKAGNRPQILFATSDTMAFGAFRAIEKYSLLGQVAIIGIDGVGGGDGGIIHVRDGILTATVRRPYLVDQAYEMAAGFAESSGELKAEIVGRATLVERKNADAALKEATDWMFDGVKR